jgi:hypothetical protein
MFRTVSPSTSILGCKADTLPHLVTKLRISGATPTPLYAIKTSTGTTLPLLNSTRLFLAVKLRLILKVSGCKKLVTVSLCKL